MFTTRHLSDFCLIICVLKKYPKIITNAIDAIEAENFEKILFVCFDIRPLHSDKWNKCVVKSWHEALKNIVRCTLNMNYTRLEERNTTPLTRTLSW